MQLTWLKQLKRLKKIKKLKKLKKMCHNVNERLSTVEARRFLQALAILSMASLATQAFAVDLLAGTETTLIETLKGTGKKYLYIAECVVSLLVYIQSKNIMVLVGIIVVAIFFNIMLTMTGSVG